MNTNSLYRPWGPDGDTPAPWSIEDTDERVIVRDAQGGLIADCTNGFDGDDGWVMSAACGPLANLIGAAPELLAFAEAFVASFQPTPYDPANDAWVKRARAAIAKATDTP